MTSPPLPHPKQCQKPRAGVTLNDGERSSWNGQRPFIEPPPALFNVTCSLMTSATGDNSRTRAMSLSGIRPATGPSLGGRRDRHGLPTDPDARIDFVHIDDEQTRTAEIDTLVEGEGRGRGDQPGCPQVVAKGGRGGAGRGILDDATDRERVADVKNRR